MDRETVLEVGSEVGFLTVSRRRDTYGRWRFLIARNETAPFDLLSEDDQREAEKYFAQTPPGYFFLSEELRFLEERYPWYDFYPLQVHPDFVEQVLDEVSKRGGSSNEDRWREIMKHGQWTHANCATVPHSPVQEHTYSHPREKISSKVVDLRYLWDEAKLHKWAPEFAGTRNWEMIASGIYAAAKNKTIDSNEWLSDVLFVLDTFEDDDGKRMMLQRWEQLQLRRFLNRRKKHSAFIVSYYKATRQKELNDINPVLAEKLGSIHHNPENSQLIVMRSLKVSMNHIRITNLEGMLVNENWLPCENDFDKQIIEELTAANRHFKIDLSSGYPRPSIILTDSLGGETALYIGPDGAERCTQVAKGEYNDWLWDPASGKEHDPFPL